MASVLQGVITTKGREVLAKSFGSVGGFASCFGLSFGFGEGGYTVSGGGRVPKVPDPALLDLDARTNAPPDDFIFGHNLTPADVIFIPPSTIQFRCKLVPSESNDDGYGNPPKFFELGVFDGTVDANHKPQGNLIAYTTFDEQTKSSTKSLITYVQITF